MYFDCMETFITNFCTPNFWLSNWCSAGIFSARVNYADISWRHHLRRSEDFAKGMRCYSLLWPWRALGPYLIIIFGLFLMNCCKLDYFGLIYVLIFLGCFSCGDPWFTNLCHQIFQLALVTQVWVTC